ncbi:hypothetical protein KY362_03490 [Candidatus Woesearchaeota archaeon]|nr:hypothetical protein [Candidatus Woesearchaeota archaeon]
MKCIVFDAGPVISLTTNNLLWLLDKLKDSFQGDFCLPPSVKEELVDRPLRTKRFKFEALQVSFRVNKGVLKVVESEQIKALAEELLELANHTFKSRGNWIKIVHYAEMEVLATAIILNSDAAVIDERTTRLLVEEPDRLLKKLRRMMHTKVFVNPKNLDAIKRWAQKVKIIRSVELVLIAYEMGLLDKYLTDAVPGGADPRQTLVDSLLWGVKIHGCAISSDEIKELTKIETTG